MKEAFKFIQLAAIMCAASGSSNSIIPTKQLTLKYDSRNKSCIYQLTIGEGKHTYAVSTIFGEFNIKADNEKACTKKFKVLMHINETINYNRKQAGMSYITEQEFKDYSV